MIDNLSYNTRLFLVVVFSIAIVSSWQYFYVEPMMEGYEDAQIEAEQKVLAPKVSAIKNRDELIKEDHASFTRVHFENDKIKGSINLVGARIDDLVLKNYKTSLDENAKDVVLFSPSKTHQVHFAEFSWVARNERLIPSNDVIWKASRKNLKAGESLTLSWKNSEGIEFLITYKLDENYVFEVSQEVKNHSGSKLEIGASAILNRAKPQEAQDNSQMFHEGLASVVAGKLHEVAYTDFENKKDTAFLSNGKISWLGFSDKYWLSAMFSQDETLKAAASTGIVNNQERFQVSYYQKFHELEKGESLKTNYNLFAGAKELELLEHYQKQYGLTLFDRAVDFGWLYFITKPIAELLHYFYTIVGNFGIAILILTVVIKALLFPLAHKGFKGMNRLKELQPKMAELKKKHEDDPQGFQKALLAMYRKEKVNPMSGCLPILLQIPVFFALYKVLYVSIEMRHAPFFGWIKDLSAPDPLSIVNLFGLIPIELPQFLMIGIFPMLMAFTMYIQQRLSPEPTDPVQAKMMKLMPFIFLFMFSSFPSGLVIYWTWSNVLSILQQTLIKKLEGEKKPKKSK